VSSWAITKNHRSVLFLDIPCGRFDVWAETTCRRLSSAHQTMLRYTSRVITGVFLSSLRSTRRADNRTSSHLQQRIAGRLQRAASWPEGAPSCPNRNVGANSTQRGQVTLLHIFKANKMD